MSLSQINQAIIVALSSELPDHFLDTWIYKENHGCRYFQKKNTILVFSGVGKVNAAHMTTLLINLFDLKSIINIGSCGTKNKKYRLGQIFLIKRAKYIDVNATTFNYKLGQIPHEALYFDTNNSLNSHLLDKLINHYQCSQGILGTADSFISSQNLTNFNYKTVDINDMEGTAILQITHKYQIPCSLIKVVSDNISGNHSWYHGIKKIDITIGNIINLLVK